MKNKFIRVVLLSLSIIFTSQLASALTQAYYPPSYNSTGCQEGYAFNTITGEECPKTSNLDRGCTSNSGFSFITGKKCSTSVACPTGMISANGGCASPVTKEGITVVSPNGGETFTKGSVQKINWKDNITRPSCNTTPYLNCLMVVAPISYDIKLFPNQIGNGVIWTPPTMIAKKVSSLSYDWKLAETLADGSYYIQVCRHGTLVCDSSDKAFDIKVVETTTPTSDPIVSIVGTPTLELTYDSFAKESKLIGKAVIKITTGNNPINIGYNQQNSQIAQLLPFKQVATGELAYSNSMVYSAVAYPACVPTATAGCLIPANSTMTFNIENTAKASELFGGSYSMGTSNNYGFIYYNLNDVNKHVVQAKDFKGNTTSNLVPIVGEVSPYISSATSDANGSITLQGVRLNLVDSTLIVDGNKIISASKGDATGIFFSSTDYGLANGYHTIQIKNSTVGDSNVVSVNVQTATPTVPAPTSVSGTISASSASCTISNGTNGCYVYLTWNTTNATAPNVSSYTAFDKSDNPISSSFANYSNYAYRITKGTTTFSLKNGTTLLNQIVVIASCVSGSAYDATGNCNPVTTSATTIPPVTVVVPAPSTTSSPTIASLSKTSGKGGDFLTIYGSGFNSSSLVAYSQGGVSKGSTGVGSNMGVSADGKQISVYMLTLPDGVYQIQVRNEVIGVPATISNAINFTIATNPTCADPKAYYYYYNQDVKTNTLYGINSTTYPNSTGAIAHWNKYGFNEIPRRTSCWTTPTIPLVLNNNLSSNRGVVLGASAIDYVWNNDLQIGSQGDDVVALQTALTKEGFYNGEISGGYYNATYTAVKSFQEKYGIKVTGYVGALTREKLNSLYGASN